MSLYIPTRITEYILKYAQRIDITDSILFRALDIAQELEEKHPFFMAGRSSSGLAAGAIYIAGLFTDHSLAQHELSRIICESGICRVRECTIKKQYLDIVVELNMIFEPDLKISFGGQARLYKRGLISGKITDRLQPPERDMEEG